MGATLSLPSPGEEGEREEQHQQQLGGRRSGTSARARHFATTAAAGAARSRVHPRVGHLERSGVDTLSGGDLADLVEAQALPARLPAAVGPAYFARAHRHAALALPAARVARPVRARA